MFCIFLYINSVNILALQLSASLLPLLLLSLKCRIGYDEYMRLVSLVWLGILFVCRPAFVLYICFAYCLKNIQNTSIIITSNPMRVPYGFACCLCRCLCIFHFHFFDLSVSNHRSIDFSCVNFAFGSHDYKTSICFTAGEGDFVFPKNRIDLINP